MVEPTSSDWGDAGLVSLLRSPFLIPSVLFHTMLFLLALRAVTLPVAKTDWRAAYHAKARYTDATDPTKRQIGQRLKRNFSSEQQPG